MLDVIYGQASEPGRVWPRNADSAAAFIPRSRQEVQSRGWMFAVADGRGGTDLGHVVSGRVVELMVQGFAQAAEYVPLAYLMPQLVQNANATVHHEGLSSDHLGGRLATMLVSCALRKKHAVISHVRDSRCYRVRGRTATLLTQDDTWVTEQRKSGTMTAVQAEHSELRHILTRALGPELVVTPRRRASLSCREMFWSFVQTGCTRRCTRRTLRGLPPCTRSGPPLRANWCGGLVVTEFTLFFQVLRMQCNAAYHLGLSRFVERVGGRARPAFMGVALLERSLDLLRASTLTKSADSSQLEHLPGNE